MFEDYYNECDPQKRKAILDEMTTEEKEMDAYEQIKALFDARYTLDKKNEYIDHFVRAFLEFKIMSEALTGFLSNKKNKQTLIECIHILCLDQPERYGRETLYREMCHLTMVYISVSQEDKLYNSVVFGLGKISDNRQKIKIYADLNRILDILHKYPDLEETFSILQEAIVHLQECLE